MTETEFKNTLPKLRKVLDFAINNEFSSFYKDKYGELDSHFTNIDSYEEFTKIPFLNKDEILQTDLYSRVFVGSKELKYFTFSSGTTNYLKPLAIPNSIVNTSPQVRADIIAKYVKSGAKNFLYLLNPFHHSFNMTSSNKKEMVIISGDIKDLQKTAIMIKEVGIDAISASPTALYFFVKELKKINFDFGRIKFISLGGEFCSTFKRKYFQQTFYNSKIETRYGSSETGLRGYQCENLYKLPPNYFHISENVFLEIIDDEIIHTDLILGKAFPAIRYKTGDMGTIEKIDCPCGNHDLLILEGRADYDLIKFSGLTLRCDLVDNILDEFFTNKDFDYQITVSETFEDDFSYELTLEVFSKENFDAELLQKKLVTDLSLAPNKKLKYFLENKIISSLTVIRSDNLPELKGKRKRVLNNFNL